MLSARFAPVSRGPAWRRHCRHAGFSAIELLVAMAMVALLAGLAYPSFRDQLIRARRVDAVVAIAAAQLAQERWRANQASYGSLAAIGVGSVSGAGHYTLLVSANDAAGYEILATAVGTQGRDADCRNLRVQVAAGNPSYASGPDASVGNAAAMNKRCWSL